MAQIASAITALRGGTLTASTFINQFGHSALSLYATSSLAIRSGSVNASLGLISGQADNRTSTFYVFNGPIVDGSNGGVTTTDPANVVVRVNNVQVIPSSVNGSTRAVTLPVAPPQSATVAIQYYFNTWQDTYDYLANVGVTSITRCGEVPGGSAYVQGTDFVLQDDKVLWGTALTVAAGTTTSGYSSFNETQVSGSLVDNQFFLGECSPVVTSSGGTAVEDRYNFTLPNQPTLGNGRNTPLGQDRFQTISNGRIDLPVNRPDVIWVYWGFDIQNALENGRQDVLSVDGLNFTLKSPVPVGATVYATYYYNNLTDETYTLTVQNPGISGIGTYTMQDSAGDLVKSVKFTTGTKGSSLNGVTIEFPSGSELMPDFRYEAPTDTSYYTGPVDETATVQFAAKVATPAKYTVPGAGGYEFIRAASDRLRMQIHSTEVGTSAGIDLATPSNVAAHVGGYFASIVSDEIVYTGGTGCVEGQSYEVTASEEFTIAIDGVDVDVKTPTSIATPVDISFFADAINEAASGTKGLAQAGSIANTLVLASTASDIDNVYVGWKVVIGNGGAAVAGTTRTITAYVGSTKVATIDSDWPGGPAVPPVATNPYYIYNPDARSALVGSTKFDSPITLAADKFDKLSFIYVGSTSTGTTALVADLGDGPFATAAALATEVSAQIAVAVAAKVGAFPAFAGLIVECVANASGQLEFRLQLPGVDAAGYLQFVANATPAKDFCILAGLDVGAVGGTGQAALLQAPVARTRQCPNAPGSVAKLYDRLILRNRILPGGGGSMAADFVSSLGSIEVKSDCEMAGLTTGMSAVAGSAAVVHPATLACDISQASGQETGGGATHQVQVIFYDGTGVRAANDTLIFEVDGYPVTVSFTSSASGTATNLGPASGGSNGSVLDQIIDAMAAVPGAPWGVAGTIYSANMVRQEGVGIRLVSAKSDTTSRITINDGLANTLFTGFSEGTTALRVLVPAANLASALMSHRQATFATWLNVFATESAGDSFTKWGIASTEMDSTGKLYLFLEDMPSTELDTNLGAGSNVVLKDTNGLVDNALRYTTGLGAVDGDGATGDAALSGFFVVSSNPVGSGSANLSILNPAGTGLGQDGVVGQTYRDLVTGLTFTILPRNWATDSSGPWVAYPTGANATFRISVGTTFTTDSNLPQTSIPGVELLVSDTNGLAVGDTAEATTHERGGNEPAVGDFYYVTYIYEKQDFTTRFFTKVSAVQAAYGTLSPDNPVSLAAYLAMINGAVIVGVKQVQRDTDSTQASVDAYRNAIDELEGVLPGQVQPDMITLMRGDSTDLYLYLKRSNALMSSMRYRSERTSILGMVAGSTPSNVIYTAGQLSDSRMRVVYPDMATITIQDVTGTSKEYLVDGPFLAAALTGQIVSPNTDVATPWTGRRLVGFNQLARQLDAVEQNQIAVKGVTVLEDQPPYIKVRHGLTTDMTNILVKLPTITLISDEVQKQTRSVLEQFVGIKFLPGILSQIEGRLAMMLKSLVAAQIISAYTGVKANVSVNDPSTCEISAYYAPIFSLLYILAQFHLRSSL
jgi:hypothetical protein